MPHISFHTAFGDFTLFEEKGALIALEWGEGKGSDSTPLLEKAKQQMIEYFQGKRTSFNLPLAPVGTVHQQEVWRAIQEILYGKTISYGSLAKTVNSGARAVGTACGKNPLPILIPCHRVLPKSGGLGRYSGEGGIATKEALLKLEGAILI